MPATYDVIGAYRSVHVFTGSTVVDAEVVTCMTKPTGIRFTTVIDLSIWELNSGTQILPAIAGILEECVLGSHAVGGTDSQDFDNNNLLAYFCDLVIAYDQSAAGLPTLYGEAHIPMNVIETEASTPSESVPGNSAARYCEAEYERLAQLAGG
jgi:hypothetical protein